MEKLNDIYAKAIISGSSVTAEASVNEAKAYYHSAGASKLDEFYKTWYNTNKNNMTRGADFPKLVDKLANPAFW